MLFHSNKKLLNSLLSLLGGFVLTLANADPGALSKLETPSLVGQPTVVMDEKTQIASGLKTTVVSSVQHQTEFEVIAKVISVAPLLALRERYLVAQAELDGAKARLVQTAQSLKRHQDLFRHGVSSKRSLQEQEAQALSDQALVDVSKVRLTAIENETRLSWGKQLAEWALSGQAASFGAFISGQQYLLQITLPINRRLAEKIKTIFIEVNGQRNKAIVATLISRSTQADSSIQGESYFFRVNADNLRIGMKASAWIPDEATLGQAGVVVPGSALLWYMDQVYAYIKVGKEAFSRRHIQVYSSVPEGYLIPEAIKTGEEVVTTGGQMLLSEELRGQIPDED